MKFFMKAAIFSRCRLFFFTKRLVFFAVIVYNVDNYSVLHVGER